MTKYVTVFSCLILLSRTYLVHLCAAVTSGGEAADPLIKLARARFPNLTRAELATLEFAQVGNVARGQFAIAGSNSDPSDPSNDPKTASDWGPQREIRAELLRWLFEEPNAIALISPSGIQVLGARIVGDLNLDFVQPPFGLALVRCSIPGRISLVSAHLRWLSMSGSYTGQIYAVSLVTDSTVLLDGVISTGELDLDGSKIDGILSLRHSHFRHGRRTLPYMEALAGWNLAVRITYAQIRGAVDVIEDFEADGAVEIDNCTIGGDFTVFGSRFSNPNNVAFAADSDVIGGDVMISWTIGKPEAAKFDGLAQFYDDQIAGSLFAQGAVLSGSQNSLHGLTITDTSVKGMIDLRDLHLSTGAQLSLIGSSTHIFIDSVSGWPAPGKLTLDGFTYDNLGPPNDADSRLRWLRLSDGFRIQPYRQLANYLRKSGDEAGATRVLIAEEDLRYGQMSLWRRIWGNILKFTIGYGHRPLLAMLWAAVVVLAGAIVVTIAKSAGVMRLTWSETTPMPTGDPVSELNPLLYSLDVFVPFVNLHQEHFWWPDKAARGEFVKFGRQFSIRGSMIRSYLWLQIIAGWLLSAIFVAGVTGLIRND